MTGQASFDNEKKDNLQRQLETFVATYWRLTRWNTWSGNILVILGLILGSSITLAGFFDYGKLAGVLGVLLTALIGLSSAFNFRERAEFFHVVHAEAKALRDHVRYNVKTEKDIYEVVESLKTLRIYGARDLPKGTGMEAVKGIYSERKMESTNTE